MRSRRRSLDGGVSAPAADLARLRQVVADARNDGVNLKIVAIDTNPPIDTPLRDIATVVGQANPGSTVLVLSPSFAGTYSPTFDRVLLEAGEDLAKTRQSCAVGAEFRQSVEHADIPLDRADHWAHSCGIADGRGDPNPAGPQQTRCCRMKSLLPRQN